MGAIVIRCALPPLVAGALIKVCRQQSAEIGVQKEQALVRVEQEMTWRRGVSIGQLDSLWDGCVDAYKTELLSENQRITIPVPRFPLGF